MLANPPKETIALLIDAESTCPEGLELVLFWLESWSGPVLTLSYGEWLEPDLERWDGLLIEHEVSLALTDRTPKDIKDSLEMSMAMDAMCLFQDHGITRFCIVTSDKELIPLIRSLRQAGAAVSGFGTIDAPPSLSAAFKRFATFEELQTSLQSAAKQPR